LRELSLHLLDIAENSISAGATRIVISVHEDLVADELWLAVTDNGKGMSPEMVANVLDPFFTTRTTGMGFQLHGDSGECFIPADWFQLTVPSHHGAGDAFTIFFQRLVATVVAEQTVIETNLFIPIDAHQAVIAGLDHALTTEAAVQANRIGMGQVRFTTLVGTPAINEGAGGAELHTVAAGNTGAFAKGHVVVGNQDAAGAAFFKTKGSVAN